MEKKLFYLSEHHMVLNSVKSATLSAGLGAFIAVVLLGSGVVLGAIVLTVRHLRRKSRGETDEEAAGVRLCQFSFQKTLFSIFLYAFK